MTIANIDTLLSVDVVGFVDGSTPSTSGTVLPSMSPRHSVLAKAIANLASMPVVGQNDVINPAITGTSLPSQSPRKNALLLAIAKGLTADIFDPAATGSSKSTPRQYWS